MRRFKSRKNFRKGRARKTKRIIRKLKRAITKRKIGRRL